MTGSKTINYMIDKEDMARWTLLMVVLFSQHTTPAAAQGNSWTTDSTMTGSMHNMTDHSMHNMTDHSMHNMTDHSMHNMTDHSMHNMTDHSMHNMTDHNITDHSMHNMTDHSMHNETDHDHSMHNGTDDDHSMHNGTDDDHSIHNTTDHEHESDDHNNHAANDHSSHGGAGHNLFFYFGNNATILFEEWVTYSEKTIGLSCLYVALVAIFYEGLKLFRNVLYDCDKRYKKKSTQWKYSLQSNEGAAGCGCARLLLHLVQTLLHMVQVFVSLCLMLVFMTYNVYLCISVVAGAGLGYLIFGWRSASSRSDDEHCN